MARAPANSGYCVAAQLANTETTAAEVTLVGTSFVNAWQSGAVQLATRQEQNSANIYRTRAAWESFEPVTLGAAMWEKARPRGFAVLSDDRINSNYLVMRDQ